MPRGGGVCAENRKNIAKNSRNTLKNNPQEKKLIIANLEVIWILFSNIYIFMGETVMTIGSLTMVPNTIEIRRA